MLNYHVVVYGHGVEWPPRSPDLMSCDFFFRQPASQHSLRERIEEEFRNLWDNPGIVRRAVRDMERGVNLCIER